MINAYRAGQDAADHAPHRPNPHNGISNDRVERLLSIRWRRGYQSRNPMVILDDDHWSDDEHCPADEHTDTGPRHLSIVRDEPQTDA